MEDGELSRALALHELELLLDERVESAKAGEISQKSVEEILQELYSASTKYV